ncbi:MAG: hypothetical protein KGY99_04070 [Phycisphaerae bacterium]|nr:hypothetical protein [Phycisphaerae bacterium]
MKKLFIVLTVSCALCGAVALAVTPTLATTGQDAPAEAHMADSVSMSWAALAIVAMGSVLLLARPRRRVVETGESRSQD